MAGIPTVIVVNREGYLVTNNGRSEIIEKGSRAFQHWLAVSLSLTTVHENNLVFTRTTAKVN